MHYKNSIQTLILFLSIVFASIITACTISKSEQDYAYKNPGLSVELRVKDLLSRMSLEEKVRQMDMYRGEDVMNENSFSPEKAEKQFDSLGVGAIHDIYPESAEMINTLQKFVIENNRWEIPALIMCEMLHGYKGEGATCFPMNIGLGATWDRELMKKVGRTIGSEARAHGVHYGLGPVLGIGREPRWGRIAETFSEDTYLAGEIGTAMIVGMQGDSLSSDRSIIAGPKHFAVHSSPQAGGNSSPVIVGERTARQDFLPVFEKAIKKGNALGLMCAYSELDGIPCAGNKWLLTDVLRKEWGFKGMVVSDLGAIRYLQTNHYVANSPKDAIRQAVTAGMDMQFYDFSNKFWQKTIIDLVHEGKISAEHIDRATGSVLRLKFMLGLFENPYSDSKLIAERFHCKEFQDLALEAAHKSICLLKNENNLLPLSKNVKTIAVIGPNADEVRLGGYSTRNKKGITVLEGIKQLVGKNTKILYNEGVPLIVKGQTIPGTALFTPDKKHHGLKGEYFKGREPEGEPLLTRIDSKLNFDWPWSPAKGVPDDHFSIRWTGFLKPFKSFNGWIGLSSDDGVRMWINNILVVDNWQKGATNIVTYPMNFVAGKEYKLRIEMWEGGYGARAHLTWNLKKTDMTPAIFLAKKADVAVVILGESRELVEENRDVATLDLQGRQLELIQAIQQTGTPVVCVLLNGRPLSINWIDRNVPAIVEAWFPGEAGGKAVADVLFGDYNPAGRLPVTFPKSAGQLPIYYNQKPSAIHRYVTESDKPLYPFGYGLSYTTFKYSNLEIDSETITPKGTVKISVAVKNTGSVAGEEVVQLYLRDEYSSVTTATKSLKGFQRIALNPQETKTLTFELTPEELSIWNIDMKRVVESGKFIVLLGGNSADLQLKKTFTVTN
ncbi:MAG: glycoside hydrolase family 3 [Bacteroidales bacterium]|nr:MAG: glycoside hydrolase family 3 [Bacteroidales bacterium]